jgi:hypothetical protein
MVQNLHRVLPLLHRAAPTLDEAQKNPDWTSFAKQGLFTGSRTESSLPITHLPLHQRAKGRLATFFRGTRLSPWSPLSLDAPLVFYLFAWVHSPRAPVAAVAGRDPTWPRSERRMLAPSDPGDSDRRASPPHLTVIGLRLGVTACPLSLTNWEGCTHSSECGVWCPE